MDLEKVKETMFVFLLCTPQETRDKFSLRYHFRERLKAGACLLGVIVGAVTLGLSAARMVDPTPAPSEVNAAIDASLAFSVVALVTGFVTGYVLLVRRTWSAYWAASCVLAVVALGAGGVITGLNFWLLAWAETQPLNVFNETRSWEQDTAKAGGFGIVLVVAALVHVLVLLFDGERRDVKQ